MLHVSAGSSSTAFMWKILCSTGTELSQQRIRRYAKSKQLANSSYFVSSVHVEPVVSGSTYNRRCTMHPVSSSDQYSAKCKPRGS